MSGRTNILIKSEFRIFTLDLAMGEFDTHRSRQKYIKTNFLNRPIHPELNCRGIERINYLIVMSQFSVLGVPRLSSVVF